MEPFRRLIWFPRRRQIIIITYHNSNTSFFRLASFKLNWLVQCQKWQKKSRKTNHHRYVNEWDESLWNSKEWKYSKKFFLLILICMHILNVTAISSNQIFSFQCLEGKCQISKNCDRHFNLINISNFPSTFG